MTPGSPPAAPAATTGSSTPTPTQTQTQVQTQPQTRRGQAASADFLLMLGQLVGGAAAGGAPSSSQFRAAAKDPDGTADDAEVSDVLGALALSLPITVQDLVAAPKATGVSDMVAELQFSRGAGIASMIGIDAQLLKDLMAASAAVDGDPRVSFDSALSPQASIEASQTRGASSAESLLSRPVHSPVGSAAWADEIGSRITMMAEQGRHTASLRLSPEHLGPLEVRISVRDDQASVWFGAAHADTRAAIEHALPRLRELFASQGLSLADAGVFREPPREHAASSGQPSNGMRGADSEEAVTAPTSVSLTVGLLDAYA